MKTQSKTPKVELGSSNDSFYFFDLINKLAKEKNIASLIYLVINIVIVCAIAWFCGSGEPVAIVVGLVIYIFSAFLSLSPLGEWMLRLMNGCKDIKAYDPAVYERCMSLFEEVKSQAQKNHPDHVIDKKIKLYIKEDPDVNAFAAGRQTICMTSGLLTCSDEEIKGILGHEFGHLANRDTDLVLLILVGNIIISAFITMVRFAVISIGWLSSIFYSFFGDEGAFANIISAVVETISLIFIDLTMWIWTWIGILLTMKTSREAEYAADAFSCEMGYYEGLRSAFEGFLSNEYTIASGGLKKKLDIFTTLAASHPATKKRIERIDEYMNARSERRMIPAE